MVLKYLNISENYVYEMAKKEQSLDTTKNENRKKGK